MDEQKLTIEQFGAIVKAKYPQYAQYSDADIGSRMLTKYPQYQSRIATARQIADTKSAQTYGAWAPANTETDTPIVGGLKTATNLFPSAYNWVKGVAAAATKPLQTATNLGRIIAGAASNTGRLLGTGINTGKPTTPEEEAFNSFAQYLKERYGGIENLQRTAVNDPFAFATEIVTAGSSAANKLGVGAGVTRAAEIAASPITKPLAATGKLVTETAIPKLLSYTSDVPEAAFKTLLERREPVTAAIKQGTDARQALTSTRQAVKSLRTQLTNDWGEAIKNIADEFTGQRFGLNDKSARILENLADEFGFELPANPKSASANEWINAIKSINELPKAVLTFAPKGAQLRRFKETLQKAVIKNFGGDKGSVAKLYKNYSTKKQIFDAANDIVNAYANGRPIKETTALNRLQNIFDANKPAYLEAIIELEKATGQDILSKITASKFKSVAPTSFNRVSSAGGMAVPKGLVEKALNIIALPLTSPRSAAFIARNLRVPKFAQELNQFKLPTAAREYIKNPKAGMSIQDVSRIPNRPVLGKNASVRGMKETPKELELLANEARKYKSAKQFEDAFRFKTEPNSYYHGTDHEGALGILQAGEIRPSPATGGDFVSLGRQRNSGIMNGPFSVKVVLDEGAVKKLGKPQKFQEEFLNKEFEERLARPVPISAIKRIEIPPNIPQTDEIVKLAKEKGIPVIQESQLTDIWNKVSKGRK